MAETPFERTRGGFGRAPAVARLQAAARSWQFALALILVLGAALRFNDLAWDQPGGAAAPLQMHPDERFLSFVNARIDWPSGPGQYFDTAHSPLNPYNAADTPSYVYGTFPLFLAKAVSTVAGDDPGGPNNGYEHTIVWGRRITATFDTLTILLVFALGATLFGRNTGLAAALLYALAVLPTQLAHFWAMDPYVVFFATATLLLAALSVRPPRGVPVGVLFGLMGLTVGLGLASKVTALPILLSPVVAAAIRIALREAPGLGLRWRGEAVARPARPAAARTAGHWTMDISWLCLSLALAIVVFRVAQPYAWVGPNFWDMSISQYWWDDIQRERNFQDGNVDFPPFVQFAGRMPFAWPLQNMVVWGLGPVLGVAAWGAVAAGTVLLFRRRELTFLLPLVFAAAVLGFQGPRFVAFMRYFAPIYPVLCLFAAWGALAVWRAAARWRASSFSADVLWFSLRTPRVTARHVRVAAAAGVLLLFGATAWWAMAFQAVYREEHPRIAASRWIYQHVPPGSAITAEIWDDALPYQLGERNAGEYRNIELELYATDSLQKVRELVYGRPGPSATVGLSGADFIVVSSNRVRHSVPRLEREYPASARYYELLDGGELGFELVRTFRLRPNFLGVSLNDSAADESFTVYDHPEVRIYRKTAAWDPQRAVALLKEAHPERAVNLLPRQGGTNGLQFTPEEAAVQQGGGTFSDVFAGEGWASKAPWVWWLLWLQLAAFASLPWVTWLFRALPDRGYGLSKVCGAIAVTLTAWLLVAWGVVDFSRALAWGAFAGVLAVGLALGALRRRSLAADLRERWPAVLATEAVFFVAFFAFLALRYANPDLWHHPQGGEKPVELAYLTAVARSTHLPPFDPWFAGGTMNYYYMGWFFLAVPMRAFRTLPEVGFNLGIPTFAALAATVAASTAYNLTALMAGRPPVGEGIRRVPWRGPLAAALLGAVLLIGIGNLDGAHQAIERLQHLNVATGTGADVSYHWPLFSDTPFLGGLVGFVSGLNQWAFHDGQLGPFDWWRSSRVHIGQFDITEFPYWSFLFADLHPHVMGLPFFGLVIALSAAYVASAAAGLRAQGWVLAAAGGVVLGVVRTVHTWDFPTATLLITAAIVLGQVLARGRWQRRWWEGVAHLALAAGILLVAFAPYTAHFEVFNSGLRRAPETTQANQYFAHFGVFVAFALAFIAVRYREELAAHAGRYGRNPFLAVVSGPRELLALVVFAAGLAAFSWGFGLAVIALSALLLLFLGNLAWLELATKPRNVPRLLITLMFALAFAIAAGVDIVSVKNDIVRMNTVFKFSLQAWQLFALASAAAGWYVADALWGRHGNSLALSMPRKRLAAWTWAATTAALLFGASIYLVSGTAARQQARFAELPWTLDGLAYQQDAVFVEDAGTTASGDDRALALRDDRVLIDWLRQNVEGSPVIVEGVGNLYHWAGRISVNTGLPAVIGWDWHEIAYRMDYAHLIQERRTETARFYAQPDVGAAEAYLRKYNVSYVVVGGTERALATPAGIEKLGRIPALSEAFRSGEDVIYRVDPSKLPPPTNLAAAGAR